MKIRFILSSIYYSNDAIFELFGWNLLVKQTNKQTPFFFFLNYYYFQTEYIIATAFVCECAS